MYREGQMPAPCAGGALRQRASGVRSARHHVRRYDCGRDRTPVRKMARQVRLTGQASLWELFDQHGRTPCRPTLPAPKLGAEQRQIRRYQTSTRARREPWPRPPLPALHPAVLDTCAVRGQLITLRQPGTFRPVQAERPRSCDARRALQRAGDTAATSATAADAAGHPGCRQHWYAR